MTCFSLVVEAENPVFTDFWAGVGKKNLSPQIECKSGVG